MKHLTLALVIALSAVGCTRVGPGYAGIKVNMAGSNKGVETMPATTGWVFYNPFSESVFEYPTFVQSAVWTHNVDEGKALNEEITFTTADQMQVGADISIAYNLNFDKVPNFYVTFRSDDLDKFTHGYMRNLARDKFDSIAGRYKIEQIMGDNAQFLADVRNALQNELTPLGVEIRQFGLIGAPRPPQQVIAAINAKVQATQVAIQTENEVRQTRAQAEKDVAKAEGAARSEVASAEGYAKAMLLRADAEAEANRKVANSLTPSLLEKIRLDKWDGSVPQMTGVGGTPMINLTPRGNN